MSEYEKAQMKEQVKTLLAIRQRQMREAIRQYDAETECMFSIIHANHERNTQNEIVRSCHQHH